MHFPVKARHLPGRVAKDSWMAAMGLGFIIDDFRPGSRQDKP